MIDSIVGFGCLAFALMAIRERRLLISVLWLALTSAMTALMMYRLGALEASVVELSVGAGLVTVLFVFAINIAGDEEVLQASLLPRPLAWGVIVVGGLLLAWMILPAFHFDINLSTILYAAGSNEDVRKMIWEERGLDSLLQIMLMFGGMMAVLSLIGRHTGSEEDNS